MHDNMSENSSQAPTLMRSKSRTDMSGASSRYQNLSYWKARKLIFYRNGDPFFPGIEYRFKPGRDVNSLETLLDKISPKMDLPRGARYVFSMDGDRKYTLDELEDGASYVLSSLKVFKVSERVSSFDSLKFVGSKTVPFFVFFIQMLCVNNLTVWIARANFQRKSLFCAVFFHFQIGDSSKLTNETSNYSRQSYWLA